MLFLRQNSHETKEICIKRLQSNSVMFNIHFSFSLLFHIWMAQVNRYQYFPSLVKKHVIANLFIVGDAQKTTKSRHPGGALDVQTLQLTPLNAEVVS